MIATLAKALLSLRYNIEVSGLEKLKGKKGVLVLPNHPAEVDPIIVSTYLWDDFRLRPIVLEFFYNLPGVNSVMRFTRAVPMPDMGFDSGPFKRRRIERALDETVRSLKNGENILMYPSGRLSSNGEEKLGGASGVYALLQRHPQVPLVLVRTRGLFGSLFSKAVTGGIAPDLIKTGAQSFISLLKNAVFFAPKRKVTVTIEINPHDFPRTGSALQINKYLESWYNAPAPEKVSLVPHLFWSKQLPVVPALATEENNLDSVSQEIKDKVLRHVAKVAKTAQETLTPETKLGEDLGLDSLTTAELLLWLDQEFEATDIDLEELTTVGSLMQAAAKKLRGQAQRIPFKVPSLWTNVGDRPQPNVSSEFKTIGAAFFSASQNLGNHAALGDEKSDVLSGSRSRVAVIVLAEFFKELPGDYLGILFPASVGAAVSTCGAIVARKIPVFLNWTAGKRSLEHAIHSTGLKKIITSKAFLDVIPTDLEFIEDRFVFIEDLLKQSSAFVKLKAKLISLKSTASLIERYHLQNVSEDTPAVVLFTSGSESLPKGVPLSHKNILSNIRDATEVFSLAKTDALLGFLPPFHSFGLTICMIMPLVTGLRVAFWPNPNESRKIAKAIALWGVTLAAGTPTFLRSILKAGEQNQFASLRLLVSGAEKAPSELFEAVKALKEVDLLEGYGITECSPVVSVNRPGKVPTGVGPPLPGVKIAVVNIDTMEEQDADTQGLILVRGDSVFSGYLGPHPIDPFVNHQGTRWYNSGDLGYLENGSLVITGRLKRFIKIGGEMVSLGAVEEALSAHAPSTDGAPTIAVLAEGTEGAGRPQLIAFAASELSTDRANDILKEKGFPHIVRINQAKYLHAIPLLGSGKTDYQTLKSYLN